MEREPLVRFLNDLLHLEEFGEPGNGLQFAGKKEIKKIGCSVDAFPEAYHRCVEKQGDLLLVHHGISKSSKPGQVYDDLAVSKLKPLFDHSLNVYGCHLPLDAHPVLGNNAQLIEALDVKREGEWAFFDGKPVGYYGTVSHPGGAALNRDEFVNHVNRVLHTQSQLLPYGPKEIHRVGICSGGAQGVIDQACEYGIDTFLLGEISYSGMFAAMDHKINLILGGHYKTETLGVQAVCARIEKEFGIPWFFIDFDFTI